MELLQLEFYRHFSDCGEMWYFFLNRRRFDFAQADTFSHIMPKNMCNHVLPCGATIRHLPPLTATNRH